VYQDVIGTTQANAPANTVTSSVSRAWTDANHNFIPDCNLTNAAGNGECGPNLNATFGNPNPATTYDPAILSGWGVRPYVWEFFGQRAAAKFLPPPYPPIFAF